MSSQLISVVVPLFNEQESLHELHRRLTESLGALPIEYELVLVNDGSRDATPELLDQLAGQDPHIVAVHLSRNFGHQPAVSAGLEHAHGHAVIVMDGDLQDPPEVLGQFIDRWREGYDVVFAVRTKRKENLVKRAGYFLFYRLLASISDLKIPVDSGDFCLMDRKVVDTLRALPEKSRFVRGLRAFVGFRQTGLRYERAARELGQPKYTFKALLKLAMEGILGFSSVPLTMITTVGVFLLMSSVAAGFALLAWAAYHQTLPAGWTGLVVFGTLLSGMQMTSLGIVGEYVRRIFVEVKGRPTFVIRDIVQSQQAQQSATETEPSAEERRAA